MKLKKTTLMTLTALYVAGSAMASESSGSHPTFTTIEITDEILRFNEQLRNGEGRSRLNGEVRPLSNGKNIHRGIAVAGADKLPFQFKNGMTGEHRYIVELSDAPVALYRGGVAGLQGTSPRGASTPYAINAHGHHKLNLSSAAVGRYSDYLAQKQETAISRIGAIVGGPAEVIHRYQLAFNGMAVTMTQEQAARVASEPGVRSVSLEEVHQLVTDVGPEHIGAHKMWNGAAGPQQYRGEGMIIGVLDTGINSDHPSFSAVTETGYVHINPYGANNFVGDCEQENFAHMCNDKLIGVRSYEVITDKYWDPVFQPDKSPWEIDAPKRPENGEDYNGHGSHTASTAAGNTLYEVDYVVPSAGEQSDGVATGFKFPMISGVAPHANVIMYQVCWPNDGSHGEDFGGCPGSALMAGIEDAIADGVDVINYSIGSTYGSFPWESPIEMAFLAAREAGISVSASAGNSYSPQYASQARGAIDHLSPWLTSVAATTHSRAISVSDKQLTAMSGGDGEVPSDLDGGGITPAYTGPVVMAAEYGDARCNSPFAEGTFSLDPNGQPFESAPIVACERGEIARVTKAANAAAGGAGGFILYNTTTSGSGASIANDAYVIPGIHVDYQAGVELTTWLANGSGHSATITESTVGTESAVADYVADFSSRGPNLANPDVMSPNLAAPGVNIYAAYADEMPFSLNGAPSDYAAISGTSMAAPHVAGAMALLQQANPGWSPAQIQSALMTTASLGTVTRSDDASPFEPVAAGYSDAGSGVINVARAQNAGLLLDETADNYRAANPRNGGNVTTLNLPYLYNDNCSGTCSWMRTFTASKDGSWTVSAEALPMEGAAMLEVSASPSQFTLLAGQTQSIMVTAKIVEVEAIGADSSQIQLLGRVDLTPADDSLSHQYLPVGVRYSGDSLPPEVAGVIHRQSGHTLTPEFQTGEIQSFNYAVSGLTKGQRVERHLKRNESWIADGDTMAEIGPDPGTEAVFFDVPEGTRRIVWEVLEADKLAYTAIVLGMDVNGDGDLSWDNEALCYSYTDAGDFCAINDPMPGRYWGVITNLKFESEDPDNQADRIVTSLAVVAEEDSGSLTVEGPASNDGITPYQLRLNFDLPEASDQDVFYGVVSLGSDHYNNDNLGDFAVKLSHIGSDTEIAASQTAAKAGDIVDYTVSLAANLLGGERDYRLITQLPASLQLLEESVSLGGVGVSMEDLTVEGGLLTLAGVQPSSAEMPRHYVFTTNDNDDLCRVPYGDDPAFYDLASTGASPMAVWGYNHRPIQLPLAANGLPSVPLYGNPEKYQWDVLAISPFGYVQFDPLWMFWPMHYELNEAFQGFPDTVIAPLWRGDVNMPEELYFDYERLRWRNAVYGIVTDKHYVFQWDGGEEVMNWMVGNDSPDPSAYFNVQTIISTEINFEPGDYEVVFAYDALETNNAHFGSIGLHGFWGERHTFSPVYGYNNDGFAFNDVDSKVAAGSVVCADYRGPEQSAVTLSFSARISDSAVGSAATVEVESHYSDSEAVTLAHTLQVPANITMAEIRDQQMQENTVLEGITVMYNDLKGTENGIDVSGEHLTAVIHGSESGATFDLVPEPHWYGITEVTVTVYDKANPGDAATTQFQLTVTSDGVDAPAPEVETEPEVNPQPESSKSDSGALSLWLMLLMALLPMRRRA
ncbi:S8 family peptidase [Ferrimonas sp. SCSIO 43195]|uniref:S8 family peptidase n=1 Tax=Ferrimonas sp. SCSIO 43195 TaxID=2822844 RepID=UPI0020763BDD|nr:S8 family peptidase [Ferrimonas sp. SCSIO 43195]USD35904.1 S8 family peptidase [Ferrimonas sp. SCSIO 43195]